MATRIAHSTTRRFDAPDEVRRYDRGRFDVLRLADATVGRGTYEPGWRWTTSLKQIVGTETCQVAHLGYVLRGRMRIRDTDGQEIEAGPGDVLAVRPGHDAWVVGDQPVEYLEFRSAATYATKGRTPHVSITLVPVMDTAGKLAGTERIEEAPYGEAPYEPVARRHGDRLRRAIDDFNRGDLDAMLTVAKPDLIDHAPTPGQRPGAAGVRDQLGAFRQGFPDAKYEILDLVEDGDRLAARMVLRGTHQGEFMGMRASGRPFALEEMHLFRMEDGLIAEHWAAFDRAAMMAQLQPPADAAPGDRLIHQPPLPFPAETRPFPGASSDADVY